MHYDKMKYESLISASPLFTFDKECEPIAYKREAYRMVEYLYCYLLAVRRIDYEPYGCEIMEVATRCIKNFDNTKGAFLNYFNTAWKQEYSHIVGSNAVDEKFRGIKITDEEKRCICKYILLAKKNQSVCSQHELHLRIAKSMNLPVEKVELIAQLSDVRVTGDTIFSDGGEEASLWDQIDSGESFVDSIASAASVHDILLIIQQEYDGLQSRQKPIVSDMITIRLFPILLEQQDDSFGFVSERVLNEIKESGTAPSQRTIAALYGRDEASVSRTIKEFVRKLKTRIGEKNNGT